MAIRISFFPTPEHKVFHYEPKYYDPRKEQLEKLYEKYGRTPEGMKKAEDEMARADAQDGVHPGTASAKGYVPGQNIRGAFSRSLEENRKSEGNQKLKKIFMLITVAAAIVVAYYLAEGLAKLIS